jgi:hypothetical protein
MATRVRIGAAIEVGEVLIEMAPSGPGVLDHGVEAGALRFERGDLSIDPLAGVADEGPPLGLVAAGPEAQSIALARRLVLE